MCQKPEWHRIEECENTEDIETRRFNRLKSDLFHTRECEIPPLQKKSMHHNTHLPFFTTLPPEIRLRIYTHLLGSQTLCIGHTPEDRKWNYKDYQPPLFMEKERWHRGFSFDYVLKNNHHIDNNNGADSTGQQPPAKADLRVLRTCRQMYTEAALLPYWLTRFVFQDDGVRRRFEKSARVGKKRAQKQAVGKYDVMPLAELEAEQQKT